MLERGMVNSPVVTGHRLHRSFVTRTHLWGFLVAFIVVALGDYLWASPRNDVFNWYISIMWSSSLPFVVVSLIGVWRFSRQGTIPRTPRIVTDQTIIFQIPTVARRGNLSALHRVIQSVALYAPRYFTHWYIDVIVDEGSPGISWLRESYDQWEQLRLIVIPNSYRTHNGTRYKARANHYAVDWRMQYHQNTTNTWIYHLDDDTAVIESTLQAIVHHVVNRGQYWMAQGILTFPLQLSHSWIARLADSVRPPDDMGRFYFFNEILRRPLVGAHGENLLLRADKEATIGWDFGPHVITEDAYFGCRFASKFPGHTAAFCAITAGASPDTLRGFIKQRQRWAEGLWRLSWDHSIAWRDKWVMAISTWMWTSSLLQNVFVVMGLAYVLGWDNTSPVWRSIAILWAFNLSFWMWYYWTGFRVNRQMSDIPSAYPRVLGIVNVMVFPILTTFEAIALMGGVVKGCRAPHGFVVIDKPY